MESCLSASGDRAHTSGPGAALEGPSRRSNRPFAAAVAGVLFVTALVGAAALRTLPPESHDVYVAQTAYEMHQRRSWLVPYFNGHPRLNKPPLSYWLTGGIAAVCGAGGDVRVWHARLASVLGGMALVGATIALGAMLIGRRAGLVGGLLAAASLGLFDMMHSGRPDMVYAALCGWQALAFLAARRAEEGSARQRWSGRALWLWGGLATMAKGPQVPLILLLAALIGLVVERAAAGRVLRVLRPAAGVPLFLAVAAPWFLWVATHGGAGPIAGNAVTGGDELAGADLRIDWAAPLHARFYVYYLLQVCRMMLPWIVLLPGLVAVCIAGGPLSPMARRLAGTVLLAMLIFGFGAQRRTHYMLPFLPLIVVLAVAGIARSDWSPRGRERRIDPWPALVVGHGLAAIALLVWTGGSQFRRDGGMLAWPLGIAAAVIAGLGIGFLYRRERAPEPRRYSVRAGPIVLPLMFAAAFVAVGGRAAVSGGIRFPRAAFARAATELTGGAQRMVTLGHRFPLLVYYARERGPVGHFDSRAALEAAVIAAPRTQFAVVAPIAEARAFPHRLRPRVVLEERSPQGEDTYCLVLVGGASAEPLAE